MEEVVKKEVVAANEYFMKCFADKDLVALCDIYTSNCSIMAGAGMPTWRGHQGVMDQIKWALNIFGVAKLNVNYSKHYSVNVINETNALHSMCSDAIDKDGNIMFLIQDLALWKKIDGKWKLYRASWAVVEDFTKS